MTTTSKVTNKLKQMTIRKQFVFNLLVILAVIVAVVLMGAFGGMRQELKQQVFARDIKVDGVQIGGLTFGDAEKLLKAHNKQLLDTIALKVIYEEEEFIFGSEELAIHTDMEDILKTAFSYNKQKDWISSNFERTLTPKTYTCSLLLDEEKLYQNMETYFDTYKDEPVDAAAVYQRTSHSFTYTDSAEGASVDIDQLCRDIYYWFENDSQEDVLAHRKIIAPRFTKEDLETNTQLIGEYKTAVDGSQERVQNMKLAVNHLDGIIIDPDQTLSFNQTMGAYTAENNYIMANVEEDGVSEGKELGGGVIQVASTLYNAALLADMEIVEREKNLWPPSYNKVGLDACIGQDNADLKIKNTGEFPIYIGATLEGEVLEVELFGQPAEHQIVIENRELSYTEAPHAEVIYSADYPEGEQHEQSISRAGYEIEVYRHYLEEGKTISSELISHDVYDAIRGVILQGIN